MIEVPLHGRDGSVRAVALVDDEDAGRVLDRRWFLGYHGYATARRTDGVRGHLSLHRFLMGLEFGDRRQVDHINRDKLDNRRLNLRVGTHAQNAQNLPPRGRAATSEYRGVSWCERECKWRATSTVGGRSHSLGYFEREEDAAAASAAFRREHMPFSEEAA